MEYHFNLDECVRDDNFKDSIFEQLQIFSDRLCPGCGAHLTISRVCLNGCHLPKDQRMRFAAIMRNITDIRRERA